MAYLGRPAPDVVSATASVETFTGNGGTTFTLGRAVTDNNPSFLEVFVSNVQQQPSVSYSVTGGTTLSFNQAPGNGEPIYVIFRDYPTAPSFLVPDAAITLAKLASESVNESKLINEAVTTIKLANGAVTDDKIGAAAVTSAKLATGLVFNGVTGFNGGSLEKANVQAIAVPATIVVDNNESGIVYFTENTVANAEVTVNFTNLASVAVGNVASYAVIFQNNLEFNAYISAAEIDGTAANVVRWLGGAPTNGSANTESYSFSVFKTAAGTYTVLGAKNDFS